MNLTSMLGVKLLGKERLAILELMRTLPPANPLKPYVGTMGDGVTSGIRRPAF